MSETGFVATASEKQTNLIETLLAEREGYTEGFALRVTYAISTGTLPRSKASEIISWLLDKPKAATTVPAGYYAVECLSGNNDLTFVKVDRPEKGKWAGYTFVKRVVGGHPDPIKGAERSAVLAAIAADPDAGPRYGREIGNCYVCGRSLTDEESRALGIGPVCRGRR